MGGLFGGGGSDAAEKSLKLQEEETAKREKIAASELKARRAATGQSRTLFSAVLGEDRAIAKKTKLGE